MHRLCKAVLLLVCITAVCLLQTCTGQQDFSVADIPDPFQVGDIYPPRPEVEVCRPIRDYITRSSSRFTNELVTNTNPQINFQDQNSRIMTSRMQSRLNTLASLFYNRFSRKIRVLKAWTPFPDADLAGDDLSLHYEGRTVRVQVSRSGDYDDLCELAVSAAFDWVYYASSNLVRLSVIPNDCDRNVDCVFMLDQSGSVGRDNHDIAIMFIRNVVSFFNIGLDATRFGLIAYSTNAYLEFDLDDHTSLSSLDNAISQVNYRGGWTATALALNGTAFVLNPQNGFGARFNSEGIPKIGILITDGKSNQYPLTYAAPALKNAGVQVYTVGIGNIDRDELRFISSDPDNEHVFILSSFRDAPAFVDFLSVVTCETPAIISPCEDTTTTVSEGAIRYFQIGCSDFTDTLQVELQDISGTSFLFCSTQEPNPGPLTANTVADRTPGVTRRSCTLSVASNAEVVYVGIQGQQDGSTFSLIAWNVLFDQEVVSLEVLEDTTGRLYDLTQSLLPAASGISYEYEITSGNEQNFFVVNAAGVLRIRSSADLDFDQQSFYRLTIQAVHPETSCQCARIQAEVDVFSSEINFNHLPEQRVPENAAVGLDIATVITSGGTSAVQYSLTGGNTNNAFRIGQSSGVIQLNNNLDFETRMSYSLIITTQTTRLGMSITGTTTQSIVVEDVNESPFFVTQCANTANGCAFSLDENESGGYEVGQVAADDPDLPNTQNGMITYRFQQTDIPFAVDSNGQITTTESLNREERETYTLTLVVSDRCPGCSISINTNIRITVNDLNDNTPLFIQGPTNVQVRENAPQGFDVAQYIAEDSDAGTNGEIEYSLMPANAVPFALNPQTGLLTVDGSIDYESVQMYTVVVTASNPDGLSVSVEVDIEVINLNDNTPEFDQNPYSAGVVEHSSTGTIITTTVQATDADLGSHGRVSYLIVEGNINSLFSINGMNGMISVAGDIDRERITAVTLTVEARDNGSPQTRQSRATVVITVTDINDNPPVFRPDFYSVNLREDIQPPFNVLRVFASDRDEPGNPNSMIDYTIQSGNNDGRFQLNSNSGQLQLIQSVDFETRNVYQLQILAADQGNPQMSDTATVVINITNVNENPPTLIGDEAVEVSELAPVGTNVARFDALDPDNMPVTFGINSGNGEGKFTIGDTSGVIELVSSLDYETTTEYVLEIVASDGSQDATLSLTVSVIDENEFTPEFIGDTEFMILEEEDAGTVVGTLMASDGDGSAENSDITFSFVQQSQVTLFNLDPDSGRITTADVLDREALVQVFQPPLSRLTIEVSARDGGSPSLQSITTITITLQDINDNPPVYSDTSYVNSLLENLASGQAVFQLAARDIDLGVNAQIVFSFSLNNNLGSSVPFEIDPDSGFIQTTEPLDCEQQPTYEFTLTATDMGTPSMSAEVQGTLTLIDENDNDPVFTMMIYRKTVNETVQVGNTLLQVIADDPDKGANGEVVYSLISSGDTINTIENQGEDVTLFAIDFSSGNLRHTTPFDFEITDQVNVTVAAHDMGVPRRSGTAQVVFTVLNVDETSPRFVGTCDASVDEEVDTGTMVTQCTAVDPDNITVSDNQIAITYEIFAGNTQNRFEIEENTGIIRTAGRLDAEDTTSYTLTVAAIDLVGRRGFTQVDIEVRNINDNAPQFESPSYEFKLTDSAINRYQSEIIIVRADDADSGMSGSFTFTIGTIMPDGLSTTVEIIATDQGTPSLSSSVNLVVTFDSQCLLQDYSIAHSSRTTGVVSVFVLCRVELRPSSLNVPLGSSSSTFYCNILRNVQTDVQWLHNGSSLTSPKEIVQGRSEVSYTISNAQFEDAGEYACKASSSRVGSLQTASGIANIQVPPTIIIPPNDVPVKEGGMVTFTCSASGTPTPEIEWLLEGEVVATGSPLELDDIDKGNEGIYICRAKSEAGEATASARLTIYENLNVVEIVLDTVNNPNEDGTCHIIDVNQFEAVLNDLTSQSTMVTAIQGMDICVQTACTPNPCANGGRCELNENAAGGYVCNCIEGFEGRNCSSDVNECNNDPCGDSGGTCMNQPGRYECTCPAGTSGHRCQYDDVCTTDICADGEICIETLSTDGYFCRESPNLSASLVVKGVQGDAGLLSDLLQSFIEQQLALGSKNRQRRQADSIFVTLCEPRFFQHDPSKDELVLLWICPSGELEPTAEDQAVICSFLLEQNFVQTCKPPNGEEIEQPTVAPLPGTNDVTLEIILVNGETNTPLDGLESTKVLEESGAESELADSTGLTVGAINAQVTGPRTPPPSGISEGGNAGAVAGGVIGGLIATLLLVVGGAVLVIVGSKKYKEHKQRQRDKQKYAIQMASIASNTSLAERGLARKTSMDMLVDNDNDYDSLPPQRPPKPAERINIYQDQPDDVYENVHREE